ncbi:MAG: tetratricopeptide repeat protein [Candidatus Baltobacteraceae bacterium]
MDYLATRNLLRKFRIPGALDADPIADALRRRLGAASAAEALLRTAEETLRPFAPSYWAIVSRADVGAERLNQVSADLYLSMRTVCRQRRLAIDAIGQRIEKETALERRPPASFDAIQLIGRGRNYLARHSASALLEAERLFGLASHLESRSVDAWIGLAASRFDLGAYLLRDPWQAFRDSSRALECAEFLNGSQAPVRALRANVLQFANSDSTAAARTYAEALEMDEDDASALQGVMWLKLGRRDFASALAHAEKGLVAHSDSLDLRTAYGIALLAAGRASEAKTWFDSVLEVEPDHFLARHYYAHVLIGLREYAACLDHLASFPAGERSIVVEAIEQHVHGLLGSRVEPLDDDLLGNSERRPARALYARAVVLAGRGETKRALRALRWAVAEREPFLATIAWCPLLESLRHDPAFGKLLEEIR